MSRRDIRKRVVLHVGAPKAGSTYLQRRLQANTTLLREMGAAYPAIPLTLRMAGNAKLLPMVLLGQPWPLFLHNYPEVDVTRLDARALVLSLLAPLDEGVDTVILSAENFRSSLAAEICSLFPREVDCTVVLIVRRQDDWLESASNQLITNRLTTLPPADFLEHCQASGFAPLETPDWHAIYQAWKAACGTCRIIVYDADNATLFERFLAAASLEPKASPQTIPRKNSSISALECAYLLRLDPDLPFEDFLRHRRRAERAAAGNLPPRPARFLSNAQRRKIMEQFRPSNMALVKEIGCADMAGVLAGDAPAPPHDDLDAIYASADYARFVEAAEATAVA